MHALVVGSTGLIGKILVQKLLESPAYESVRVIVRRKSFDSHPKLHEVLVDFENLTDCLCKADHVFCTLGTTRNKAGSKEAFRLVDYQYPLEIAQKAFDQGGQLFAIVTSMGASLDSWFFYNQVKGEVERDLAQIPFQHLGIFRPSMLLGDRTENRFGESIGQRVMEVADFLLPQKYKAIEAEKVAKALLQYALNPPMGVTIYESDAMQLQSLDAPLGN
ncbi:MAG: oxidoreductase [Spirosomataceae bacterium]